MNLVILSPDKEIYNGPVKSVKVPGADGSFEMLNNHAAMVSALGKGEVRIITPTNERIVYQVQGGVVEVLHNEIAVLVSSVKEVAK